MHRPVDSPVRGSLHPGGGGRLAAGALRLGQGCATEAARAALDFGFVALGLPELVSFTSPGNERSIAVMRRLGMTRGPKGDFEHPRPLPGSRLSHHVLYRVTRRRWPDRKVAG